MSGNERKRRHDADVTRMANTYARAFNDAAERMGIDLPMPAISKLIELFGEAIYTGEVLEDRYRQPDKVLS